MSVTLNEHGLLPESVHDLTLDQIGETFGRFQRSDRRPTLFSRLTEFVREARLIQPPLALYVDGSFGMASVDDPDDIDLVIVLPASWDARAELRPFEYNVVSRRRVRKRYRFDLLVALEGSVQETEALEFFRQVNVKWIREFNLPAGIRKGVVRLRP